MNPEAVLGWFFTDRGITRETLNAYGVKLSGENVQFPYPVGVKERPDPSVPLPPEKRRFYFTRGVLPGLYVPKVQPDGDACFLVEGETDAMKLYQETGGKVPIYGISGLNTWRTELAADLEGYKRVHVILDNDEDYAKTSQLDKVWHQIRRDLPRAKRHRLPTHVKDVCEFFEFYDMAALKDITSKMSVSRFKPVDFSITPPVPQWVLKGWIAKGDVTVLAGLGGLGKSWVTMGLAVAVLNGEPEFLELPVEAHGRVLYVDEENPIDVVYSRLLRLGLDPNASGANLRFLWNCNVRLDRDSEALLDEAHDFKPEVIFIDSLSRVHSSDENSSAEMGALINDHLKPLARETGAAVVLIHHHDKGGHGPRGSGDIVNAPDAVIGVFSGMDEEQFVMKSTKNRRHKRGDGLSIQIEDQSDGTVKLIVDPPLDLSKLDF